MSTQEVGLRLALKGRREVGSELKDTKTDLDAVGDSAEKAGVKASRSSRAWTRVKGVLGGVASGLGRMVKGGVLTATAVGVGLIGTALAKGFSRLTSIENATAKLKGLGHTGKAIDKIMKNALGSVRGTAFGMDEAASVAAGAVAAGIKPGKDLERTLKLVADSATIAGSSMGEMGGIWNKVATSNKVQGDVINQLSDRGIPIVKLLGQELGVTSDEVLAMSKKGTIGFDAFRKAMESGMGGSALKSGNTTQGALKNVQAALGRFGAAMMSGAFPMVKRVAKQAMIVIDGLTERITPLMERMNASFGPKMAGKLRGSGNRILGTIDRISASIGRMVEDYKSGGFKGLLEGLKFKGVGKNSGKFAAIGTSLGTIGDAIGKVDWDAVQANLGSGVSDTVSVFSVAIGFAAANVDTLARYLPQLVTGLIAFKVAQAAANVAALAQIPIGVLQLASQVAHTSALRANTAASVTSTAAENTSRLARIGGTIATVASTVATKAAAAGQWLLNAAMSANPIGLVIAAVALLVGGFVLLYKKSDTFRGIVDTLWGALKKLGSFVIDVFVGYLKLMAKAWLTVGIFGVKAFRMLLKGAFMAFDGILSAAEKGLGWIKGIGGKIKGARAAFDDFGDKTISKLDKLEDKLKDTQKAIDGVARDRSATITINATMRRSGAPDLGADEVAGMRAKGGPVTAGRSYVVGEHRPELFTPKTSGMILPSVPAPTDLDGLDVTVGRSGPSGPTVIQVVLPDGRVLFEYVAEEADEMAGRQ